jgi:hypothetical protein
MATIDVSSQLALPRLQHDLVARLSHVRRRVRARLLIEGLAIVLSEAAVLALFTFWADHTFRLGVGARIALLAAAAVTLVYETWRRIILPLAMRLDLVALAGAIGRKSVGSNGDLAARVASVLELPRLLEGRGPPSAAMIERAVRRRHEALAGVDFDSSLDHARLRKMLLLLVAAVIVPAALVALFPNTAELWAQRMFLGSREPWPQNTYLQVADERDGRIQVPRGEAYVLRAMARGGSVAPDRISLTIRGADKTTVLMKQFDANDFRHDFAVVEQPLTLELEGGDDDYGPITLDPVDRPRIVGLELTAKHPRQTAAETHNFNGGDADLSFLVKTQLALSIAANVPLAELRLKPQSAHPTPGDLRRVDASHYTVAWVQDKAAKFELELVAQDSHLVSLPVPVIVGLKVDQPPRVTMAYSGVRQRITPQAKVPLVVDARDDFGLAAVALAIKDETPDPVDPAKLVAHVAPQRLFPADKSASPAPNSAVLPPELQLKQAIEVAPKKLSPGSFLSVTAEATDDCYTGPQTNRSRTWTFGIVSPEELFREILQRQQSERIKFRKQTEEAEKIRDSMQSATDAKTLGEIARRHRAVQLETLRIGTVLAESLTEIKLNGLGSPESHALMERNVFAPLKALQDELISPQTAAIDALVSAASAAADAGSPGAAAPNAEKLRTALDRQEQIISRMKEILKQMAQWDSFVDVLNQLEQIIKLETGVKDRSEKLERKDTEGLFDK